MANSQSGKFKDNLNFRAHYGAAKRNEAKVQELLRKVKAICTGFSVLASQSVEFSFAGKTKNQILTTSCRIVTLAIYDLFKSFGLYLKVSKSRKQILASWILPKNKRSSLYLAPSVLRSELRLFSGRIEDTIFFSRFTDL